MAIDNNDFTHEFQIYSTDLNAGTMGTGKFLLFDNNINAVKVESVDNIKIGGGSNGKILATDGEGNLRWVSAAAGSGGVSSYNDLDDLPTLFSGNYNDLTNKPTLFTANQSLDTGNSVSFNRLTVTGATGIEGGEIQLAKAPSSTLAGDVIIDIYDNKIRFFESGGTSRGFYLDLSTGANNTSSNIMSDSFSGSYNDLTNKPTVATSAYIGTTQVAFNRASGALTLTGVSIDGNAATVSNGVYTNGTYANPAWITSLAYSKLTDAPSLATVATSGAYADLTGKPSLATVATTGSYSDLTNRPTIFSGAYADLTGKPTLFDGAYLSLTGLPNLAAVATSGSYEDLSNKPSIPSLTGYATEAWVTSQGYGSGSGSGAQGPAGADGADGQDGASAYEVAVANGFIGNQSAWLASLVGATGQNGTNGNDGAQGEPGAQGPAGNDGAPGQGVPTGGTVGQVLAKIDSTDYSTEWITPASGSGPTNEITNTDGVDTWSVSVGTDGVVTMTTSRGGLEFGALPEPGGPTHFHIMRPAGAEGATDLYFGDDYNYVKLPAQYGSSQQWQQGVEIGASLNEGAVSVWKFGADGDLVLPAGKTIRDTSGTDLLANADTLLEPYKGFRAHYGTMYNNTDDNNGPINKLVIYKSTVTPSSSIDTSTESDDFQVTGLTGSDVVAMLVVVTDGTDWDIQTPTATLKTFVEKIIDEVILDEGVEGDVNTVSAMKSAFYANFSNFGTIIPNPKVDLEFFTVNNQFNISPEFATGDGANFGSITYNMSNDTLELGNWGQGLPNTHEVNDVYVIPGNTIQDANSNFLLTPDNDVTVTITGVSGGAIQSYTVTGTLPRPAEIWPNSIDDGGDDEYDGGNAIHTNLATDINYRGGDVYIEADEFNSNGNSTYVVTYQAGIFGIFATGCDISTIGTSGNDGGYGNDSGSSGFDGDGTAVTGSLYGDSESGVNVGDFVFTGSTLTATGNGGDMFIKAGDDLWLDALDDDIHIRANDDVRIKVGYDFTADTAEQEWRFDTAGYINFPDGTTQSTAWTGSVDYSNINNTPTIPTSFSSLVNGVHTASLDSTGTLTLPGVLTLPQGTTISDATNIVTVTLDQFNDGGFTGTQVFTKTSDTRYELSPTGPYMELVSGIWRIMIGVGAYYYSTDLITWDTIAGSSPAPVGTLGTLETMNLTVGSNVWTFDDDGNLTTPSSLVIGSRPGGGSHIQQNDAALEIVGEGANSVVQIGWTANQSAPDSVALIAMNLPNGGEGNVLIAVGNNATTVNHWLFDNTGNLTLPAGGDIKDSTGASVLGGGTTLPSNASGYLVNDGSGNLSWAAGDGTFSGDYDDLTNKPTLFDGAYSSLTGTPALFSGSYTDLTDKPTIPTSFSSLVNGSFTASLDSNGELSLPTNAYTEAVIKELSATALVLFAQSTGGNIKLLAGATSAGSAKQWLFNGTDGKLTAPGNLQVDGGKIILNSAGNAYVESVDYGVNSANSAVNIFGGPYQKIKLRAGFGTEATWTFDTSGDLTAPRNIILNNPVTTVTTSVTGTVADSNGNPFTFRILKADNPQLVIPFADPNFVLKWTGSDAGSQAAAAQAPGGQGVSSLVSDDGTYWNFNSWFGLNISRPNTGTVFTVEYGVVDSDTTISTTDTNLIIEADTKQWTFSTDGDLTLPAGGNLTVTGGVRKSNRILTTTATLTLADAGGFIQFNGGPYTVTLPDPTLAANAGIGYRFWQNTASNITLSTPAGAFFGPSGTTTSTVVLAQATTSYWDVWSDGFNWAIFGIKIA